MPLTKSKGNMYKDINATWNPIKGRCPHACTYCWMNEKWDRLEEKFGWPREQFLREKELKDDLGSGNFIFVCSATDMWAREVEYGWIRKVLARCAEFSGNQYLFQSKNPHGFKRFEEFIPSGSTLCTTIESDKPYEDVSIAPTPATRADGIYQMKERGFEIAVTIEPIMKFHDLDNFVMLIGDISPDWVWIGADSQGRKLPEPSREEVNELIERLKLFTEVRMKDNLGRLKGG